MPPLVPRAALFAFLAGPAFAQDARALFVAHCASCHGESGDGKGTTQLDRPARSFKDGGFSYGNTPEAIVRTITFGIPGTPMPAAPSVLTDAERRALAEYVISLGPPGVVVKPGEGVMTVRDQPLVARGKLPPIAADLPERPRGLLIGTTDGLTFEYRTDDVRLLGVRQGGFVERRDWIGRGGDALQPLGKIVWLSGKGDPGPTFTSDHALAARIESSWIESGRCGVSYRLSALGFDVAARVKESVGGRVSVIGSGFERRFTIEGNGPVVLRVGEPGPAWLASGTCWCVRRRDDGAFEATVTTGLRGAELLKLEGGALTVDLGLAAGETRAVVIGVILAPKWDDDVLAKWLAEVAP